VIAAGVRRVVIATTDPAKHGAGSGIDELRAAGIEVEVGLLGDQAQRLIAPFTRLMSQGLPWVHAKWAMTLDGKIATASGSSQWISGERSRAVVHQLRGRMDAIITGIGTVLADDPLLTARPPGPRTPLRIVLDSTCRLPLESQLVKTATTVPVMIVTTEAASSDKMDRLREAGVEVLPVAADAKQRPNLLELLRELGRRRMTNVLVEAGGHVIGSILDQRLINEVHAFIAPKLIGGQNALSPVGGIGIDLMSQAITLRDTEVQTLDGDIYVHGDV
jgi:diaminohydroxyphosphoribosylaminopyrimidine deaminase/5-amino-6-(5-phosphoribosylamino)uracil reductase